MLRATRWAMGMVILGVLAATNLVAEEEPEAAAAGDGADAPAVAQRAEYDASGALLRPEGYEEWVLVGNSQGLSYGTGASEKPPEAGMFHGVYLPADAYAHYVATGEFAEQTIFVVTNCPSERPTGAEAISRHGRIAGAATGLEVSVKDSKRFADGWGYFMFHSVEGKRTAGRAFPRQACFDCHAEHGAQDAVFTQFYSALRTARSRQLARAAQP